MESGKTIGMIGDTEYSQWFILMNTDWVWRLYCSANVENYALQLKWVINNYNP